MMTRGKARKFDPTIPKHIDQAALPKGVYWDRTGRGRWYVFLPAEGPPPAPGERQRMRRETIAGPDARLSDLHAMIEGRSATGSLRALAKQYHANPKFAKLAATTRADYEYSRDVLLDFPTQAKGKVGELQADRIRTHHVQRTVDKLDAHESEQTAALHAPALHLGPAAGAGAAQSRQERQRGIGAQATAPGGRDGLHSAAAVRARARRPQGAHRGLDRALSADRHGARLPVPPPWHRDADAH